VRTDALAQFLGRADARLNDHPLPKLLRAGIPVSLSTDDPAMFDTNLSREFSTLDDMGLRKQEIISIAEGGFSGAFLPPAEKSALLQGFRSKAAALALL
jgi:adenosine deaminase